VLFRSASSRRGRRLAAERAKLALHGNLGEAPWLIAIAFFAGSSAWALDPDRRISQYGHIGVTRSRRVLRRTAVGHRADPGRVSVDWNGDRVDPFRLRAVHALATAEGISSSGRSDHQTPGGARREPLDRHRQRTGAVARPEPCGSYAGGALRRSPRRPPGHDLGGTHAGAFGASAPVPFCARRLPVFQAPGRVRAQLCPGSARGPAGQRLARRGSRRLPMEAGDAGEPGVLRDREPGPGRVRGLRPRRRLRRHLVGGDQSPRPSLRHHRGRRPGRRRGPVVEGRVRPGADPSRRARRLVRTT
jgi:hypothetical protein